MKLVYVASVHHAMCVHIYIHLSCHTYMFGGQLWFHNSLLQRLSTHCVCMQCKCAFFGLCGHHRTSCSTCLECTWCALVGRATSMYVMWLLWEARRQRHASMDWLTWLHSILHTRTQVSIMHHVWPCSSYEVDRSALSPIFVLFAVINAWIISFIF